MPHLPRSSRKGSSLATDERKERICGLRLRDNTVQSCYRHSMPPLLVLMHLWMPTSTRFLGCFSLRRRMGCIEATCEFPRDIFTVRLYCRHEQMQQSMEASWATMRAEIVDKSPELTRALQLKDENVSQMEHLEEHCEVLQVGSHT